MDLKGRLLANRYEILEKIGSGGMATVYKAKCHVLNRYVAIKILRDEFTTDEEFVKRFEVEAQSAASITHPNIVSVYDVGVDGNLHYIVMELVKGKTLKDIIVEEKGPLPWKWSVNIAIQIASALETAHKNHIIHRDIKPHNIIITEDGVAKVTDFGIAKAVSNSTITAFGTTIGSVHYFSPEHARGGFTDAKSDLYSLGVVMYEMVTGRVPFDADTPVSVALKHMQEQPEEPIEVNPNVPIAINKIIMRALQKDTTLRYQTATEMLTDLRKALKNPNGDFVDDKEYDPTAATQIINTEMYNNVKNRDNEEQAENGKTDNKLKRFIKKHKKLSIFIGLILLFSLSLGGTILALNITNPEVNIPNVVGMAKDEAQREVENEKLKFSIEKEEYNKDVPEGFIISQKVDGDTIGDFTTTPSTDRKVKEGTTIKVIVSKGQEKTTVPKVIGMKQDEAIKALEDANLKAEVIEETSKKVEEGYVISQETDANAEAYAGDTVKIHVSTGTGIKQVTVVSVIGQDEATAKKTLTDLGLKVNITYADSKSDNGKVAKQSLDSGKVVDEGTTITLTVNKVAESKNVTVNINVKAITGGYTENANETETTSKKVNIKVNNETRTGIDKNKSDFSITLSGKDGESGQITVVITDPTSGATLYSSSKTITYGSQDAVSFN